MPQKLAQEMVVFEGYGERVEDAPKNAHGEDGGADVL
jgi:hypothetical protein